MPLIKHMNEASLLAAALALLALLCGALMLWSKNFIGHVTSQSEIISHMIQKHTERRHPVPLKADNPFSKPFTSESKCKAFSSLWRVLWSQPDAELFHGCSWSKGQVKYITHIYV